MIKITHNIDWTSSKLEKDGKIIHYYSHIDGNKPYFFFLHGITDNGLCYSQVGEQFVDRFNVILPDARGHGQSSDPPKHASVNDMLEDIRDICDHLHVDKIFIQGHSMGGAESAIFSATYPDRVSAVILEDPVILSNKILKIFMRIFIPLLRLVPHKKSPRPLEDYIKKSKFLNRKWSEYDQLVWAKAQQEYATHYLGKNISMLKDMPNWNWVLSKIKVPILLFTSQRGIVRKHTVKKLKKIKPDLNWEYVRGAGHNIRREQFEHEIDAIKKFLAI